MTAKPAAVPETPISRETPVVPAPSGVTPGGRFAAAAAAAKAEAAAAAAPPKRKCTSQWDGDCEKPDPNKPSCGPDWCSKWTTSNPNLSPKSNPNPNPVGLLWRRP